MKHLLSLVLILVVAAPVLANPLPGWMCEWEGGETVLGILGDGTGLIAAPAIYPEPVFRGDGSLRLEVGAGSGPAEAAVLYIWGTGGEIFGGFSRFTEVAGEGPYCTVHAYTIDHYPFDISQIGDYIGGSSAPAEAPGWEEHLHLWEVPTGSYGVVLTVRVHGEPGQSVWIDDLVLHYGYGSYTASPCFWIVDNEDASFSDVKALYR